MTLPDNHPLQLKIQVVGEFMAEPFGAKPDDDDFLMLHWSLTDLRTDSVLRNASWSLPNLSYGGHRMAYAWRLLADDICTSNPIQNSIC